MLFSCCSNLKQVKTDGNSKKIKLIWDFSIEKNLIYSLTRTTTTEFNKSKNGPILKSIITGKGTINVQAKSNNLGDFSITNYKSNYKWFKEDGTLKDSISILIQTETEEDIKPNGSFGESENGNLFKLLMPLPSSNMQIGESYKVPMKILFNDDPIIFAEGFNTITFTEVKYIHDRKCAVFNGILDVSNLNISKDLEGDFRIKITGDTKYYFDIAERCYVSVDIHMVENKLMDVKSKAPKRPNFYSMESHDVFEIRLQRVVDSFKR